MYINGFTREKVFKIIDSEFKGKSYAQNVYGHEVCAYLNEQGFKCFVGLFIPDEHPGQQEIDLNAEGLLREHPDLKSFMPLELEYLTIMQSIHDSSLSTLMSLKEQKDFLKKELVTLEEKQYE